MDVQRDAIARYASQYNLNIVKWFEEKETAAKLGRPLFADMMKNLKNKKADGVIIHKIDRGARNLKDWADIGNLIDQGIEVHFAHESLDLQARGGRLSADIQAVIAADYVRNLRQETIKGLYGRLKQGIWPFKAPVGYINTGKGKLKTICPQQGPIIKKTFELYATKKYTLRELLPMVQALGLKGGQGSEIHFQGLATILKNPFYTGILKAPGGVYEGRHEALISPALFQKVQGIMKGKVNQKVKNTQYVFRKMIRCSLCNYSLIPEIQKGHVYYRCHTKTCPTKSVRQKALDNKFWHILKDIQFLPEELAVLEDLLTEAEKNTAREIQRLTSSIRLQKTSILNRLERLTDCYLEEGLDKVTYESRKNSLLIELKQKENAERNQGSGNLPEKAKDFLELSKRLTGLYESENLEEKKEMVEIVTSNLEVSGKKLMFSMRSPFLEIAERRNLYECWDTHDMSRKNRVEFDLAEESLPAAIKPLSREELKDLLDIIMENVSDLPKIKNKGYEL